jgi:high-affinity iron transporter
MLEALIITLREGIEAALLVGIIVAFLRREGADRYLSAVWSGIGVAVAGSLAGAFVLYRWAVNEEAFEGILYVASAIIVATLLIWMWRHAHSISGEMKGSLGRILERDRPAAVMTGLFLFTFLMVFREGVETVLFLSAVSLSTQGLLAFLGALLGLGAAVAFAVFFVRGSLKIDLGRFFTITGIALLIFIVQLLLNGYHELSEAEWLPANPTTMAVIGPLVKNEFFFVAAVLALPLLILLIPGRRAASSAPTTDKPAQRRLERAQQRRQSRARVLGSTLGLIILAVLGLSVVYGSERHTLSPATELQPGANGAVHIPVSTFSDGNLHRFAVDVDGAEVRFIGLQLGDAPDDLAITFDACKLCGADGYYQDGNKIVCLRCESVIYPPSIGQGGGCNPIPLDWKIEGDDVVVAVNDLRSEEQLFR